MNRFTIIERDGCVLVEGLLPMRWMSAVTSTMPKKAVLSPQLAGMLGANFAFGMPEDVDALIAAITPEHEAEARRSASSRGLSEAAAIWLATGERGNSSETMFTHLTGVNANRGTKNSHPYDPDDLRRCLLLLDQVPELKAEFPRMASVSPAWRRLVECWSLLSTALIEEWGDIRNPQKGVRAEKTYTLIKNAIGDK